MRLLKRLDDKLVAKVNNIDTILTLKTKYDADKTELEKRIPNTSRLVEKSDYSAKTSELENKIPIIGGLVTTFALAAVENKLPVVSSLVKKTNYDTKIKITDYKYITMTNILLVQNLIR